MESRPYDHLDIVINKIKAKDQSSGHETVDLRHMGDGGDLKLGKSIKDQKNLKNISHVVRMSRTKPPKFGSKSHP